MRGVDSFLAVKRQTALKTPQTQAALSTGDFLAFNNESMSAAQQIISNPSIRRRAMQSRAFTAMGTKEASGNIEFTASNFVLDTLLPLIFHDKTGDADDADGAVYTLEDGGSVAPFTTFVGFNSESDGKFVRKFYGCKVNTASFSARVDDFLRLSLGVVAIGHENEEYTALPTYHTTEAEYAFNFIHASISIQAGDMSTLVKLPVESIDFNINHNIDTNSYRLGDYHRNSLEEGMTDVDGTFTLDMGTKGFEGEALALSGATHQADFLERIAAEARFASFELVFEDPTNTVDDGGSGVPSVLKIEIPHARLETPSFNVTDAGRISGSARFIAYDTMTVTHVSNLA